jgi:hypothetical protein
VNDEQDPHLLHDSGDDPVNARDDVAVEFQGTIRRRPNESERAWQALLAVARLRPHTQRHPKLYERLEVSRDTLHKWRSQHRWNDRLRAWNELRSSDERRQIASQRHDAEVAVAGLARALAIKLGERIAEMPAQEIAPHVVPQYVTALSRLMSIVDHDEEVTDGLLDLGQLAGGIDDGVEHLVDLAAIDAELADRVLVAFGSSGADK